MSSLKEIITRELLDLNWAREGYEADGNIGQSYQKLFGQIPEFSPMSGEGYQSLMILLLLRKVQELEFRLNNRAREVG